MRGIAGFSLFFIGIALGVFVFFPTRTAPRMPAAEFQPQWAATFVAREESQPSTPKQVHVASPQAPLFVPTGSPFLATVASGSPASTAPDSAKAAPAKPAVPTAWHTDVALEPLAQASAAPIPRDPYELIRELQSELRRVGCYYGRIDASWGPASKRAMAEFTERVNASLPVEEPDGVLLTLLRGQTAKVCNSACQSGQAVAADGTCVPNTLLADAERKARAERRRAERAASEARPANRAHAAAPVMQPVPLSGAATRPEPLPGRMAIGAPPPADRLPGAAETESEPSNRPRVPLAGDANAIEADRGIADGRATSRARATKAQRRHARSYGEPPRRRKKFVAYDFFFNPTWSDR